MELAILLLVLVLVELVVSVWMLARHKMYLRRLGDMETKIRDIGGTNGSKIVSEPVADTASINDLVSRATPEDIEQARQVLYALGLGGEMGHGADE